MSKNVKPIIYVATIIDTFNYGTVMQAVATKDLLEGYGHPIFIDYYRPQWTPDGHRRIYLERAGNQLVNRGKYALTLHSWNRQRKMFREFVTSELKLCDANPFVNGGDFDPDAIYCVGSDQTWNFEENGGLDPVYFLINVPDGFRKIALSASFGRDSLVYGEIVPTRNALKSFNAISVRESSSVEILHSIGLDGIALKDPVLLCRPELWHELSSEVSKDAEPYVLVYQLNKNPDMFEYARCVADEFDCSVRLVTFNPRQTLQAPKGFKTVYLPVPTQWLALFRDASYIVTDSFHGTCFSLLFERPMTVFDPPSYSVRITDVLTDFGLSGRHVVGDLNTGEIKVHHNPIDWKHVRDLKLRFADEARRFLDGCLEGDTAYE